MKTLMRFLFFGAFIGFLGACTESPELSDELSGMELKSAAGDEVAVFTVNPSGDDDTQALKEAFDAAIAAGHGSIVQLGEGTYYLNFIEIREFYGTFRGAGKGVTVITTYSGIDDEQIDEDNLTKVLIRFVGGDVRMSDMTLTTPSGKLNPGICDYISALVGFTSVTPKYTSENGYINVVADNLEFQGHNDNAIQGLIAESCYAKKPPTELIPLSHIDISVTNCSFDGIKDYGILVMMLKEGKIVVGKKGNGNTFNNIKWASVGVWHLANVEVSIEGNTFIQPTGTRFGVEINPAPYEGILEQVDQMKVITVTINQNEFNVPGGTGGILVNDRRRYFKPAEIPMLVEVKNNAFILSNNGFTGIGCFNMYGMVIRNNKFAGNGQYGVRVMGTSPNPYNENGLMLGNNFANATFSITSVLFDVRSKNWTIVGGDLGGTLTDKTNGAGNHLITGMNFNTSEVPPGQTITDNLEEMRDAVKNW